MIIIFSLANKTYSLWWTPLPLKAWFEFFFFFPLTRCTDAHQNVDKYGWSEFNESLFFQTNKGVIPSSTKSVRPVCCLYWWDWQFVQNSLTDGRRAFSQVCLFLNINVSLSVSFLFSLFLFDNRWNLKVTGYQSFVCCVFTLIYYIFHDYVKRSKF